MTYKCNACGTHIKDSFPHFVDRDFRLCRECSFINGKISEKEYLKWSGVNLKNAHVSIKDGKSVIWLGNKPPWELTNKDYRKDPRYADWRKKVFQRDSFTCQDCGQVGGELNAHHIKPFSEYESLRFDVTNGKTLCLHCHRKAHRK